MSGKKEIDLIQAVCGGEQFGKIPCKYYNPSTECNLLKKGRKLKDIFKNGKRRRCRPDIKVSMAVKRNLDKYKKYLNDIEHRSKSGWQNSRQVFDSHIGYVSSVLINRLKNKSLDKGHNLAVFQAFINTASEWEVIKVLRQEGVMPEFICGLCIFLSNLKPYVCEREFIPGDGGNEKTNPNYNHNRRPSDHACQEGFKPLEYESCDENNNDGHKTEVPEPLQNRIDYDSLTDIAYAVTILKRRAQGTTLGINRTRYTRQLESWVKRLEFMNEYDTDEAVENELAKYFDVTAKTIQRDFKEIRKYLRKKMSDKL
ncbi:MAG: hypothetical protein GY749_07575 [Desulfobacteraceae bacterium]|nr:hypothetical protein [Desulfobacteraceae bacterium]